MSLHALLSVATRRGGGSVFYATRNNKIIIGSTSTSTSFVSAFSNSFNGQRTFVTGAPKEIRNGFFASSTTTSTRMTISQMTLSNQQQHPMITQKRSVVSKKGRYGALAASKDDSMEGKKKINSQKNSPPKKKIKSNKVQINPNWEKDYDAEALNAEFNKLAVAEGFDSSNAHYADDKTFEKDFDFDDMLDNDDNDDDDDFLDFGDDEESREQSMDERIAAAKRDTDMGRVSVPGELDEFSQKITGNELRKLGYRKELNPFGNDETPRREQFKLITNSMVCSACGANFQSQKEERPGYLPLEKFETQQKLGKIEELQKLQEKADSDSDSWSTEDEIEWLIQTAGSPDKDPSDAQDEQKIDVKSMADQLGIDLLKVSDKKIICKRCHGLQNFGEVPESLRPGWTDEPLLSQKAFRDLLLPIKEKPAVIIALVDLFDFSGSVLPELDAIAGDNPVLIAANKVDLLPDAMGLTRAENWVRRELEYLGVESIANIGGAVRAVSCKSGFGLSRLLDKARSLAEEIDGDIYVVGAANAGKSTLLNYILSRNEEQSAAKKFKGKRRAGNSNAKKEMITTSPLPGTTLKFIKADLGDGRSLYDTPGLLVPGTLTQLLTPAELKMVVPKRKVEPITFRVGPGKCVLIGGLARIEVSEDSKPFLFTFFVSNEIKLHPTKTDKADEFLQTHAGNMITPPLDPGPERMEQIGEFEHHDIEVDGAGWKEAGADITLRGIGWVAVTGAGTAKVRVSVPKGIGISVRPPLMPFDVWAATARYTGGRSVRKSGKSKSGKRRKGVGRR